MIKHLLIKFLTAMLALMALSKWLPGIDIQDWSSAAMAVLVLGMINAVLKPVLSLLTFPINFLSFGLFSFVLNALLFALTTFVVPGFHIHGFIYFLLAPIAYGVVSTCLLWILEWVLAPEKKHKAGT